MDLKQALTKYQDALNRKSQLSSMLAEALNRAALAKLDVERIEAEISKADHDVERFDKARRKAGWKPPRPHSWKVRRTGRKGVDGFLVTCRRCRTRIFLPKIMDDEDEMSDFQRRIRIVLHFMNETMKMPEAFYRSMSIPSDGPFGFKDVGLHGRLAEECDLVIELPELLKDFLVRGVRPAEEEFQ